MKKAIADILRRARRERRESQRDIAERLSCSQQMVSRLERGTGSLDRALDLCRALAIPVRLEIGGEVFPLVHPIDPEMYARPRA